MGGGSPELRERVVSGCHSLSEDGYGLGCKTSVLRQALVDDINECWDNHDHSMDQLVLDSLWARYSKRIIQIVKFVGPAFLGVEVMKPELGFPLEDLVDQDGCTPLLKALIRKNSTKVKRRGYKQLQKTYETMISGMCWDRQGDLADEFKAATSQWKMWQKVDVVDVDGSLFRLVPELFSEEEQLGVVRTAAARSHRPEGHNYTFHIPLEGSIDPAMFRWRWTTWTLLIRRKGHGSTPFGLPFAKNELSYGVASGHLDDSLLDEIHSLCLALTLPRRYPLWWQVVYPQDVEALFRTAVLSAWASTRAHDRLVRAGVENIDHGVKVCLLSTWETWFQLALPSLRGTQSATMNRHIPLDDDGQSQECLRKTTPAMRTYAKIRRIALPQKRDDRKRVRGIDAEQVGDNSMVAPEGVSGHLRPVATDSHGVSWYSSGAVAKIVNVDEGTVHRWRRGKRIIVEKWFYNGDLHDELPENPRDTTPTAVYSEKQVRMLDATTHLAKLNVNELWEFLQKHCQITITERQLKRRLEKLRGKHPGMDTGTVRLLYLASIFPESAYGKIATSIQCGKPDM